MSFPIELIHISISQNTINFRIAYQQYLRNIFFMVELFAFLLLYISNIKILN